MELELGLFRFASDPTCSFDSTLPHPHPTHSHPTHSHSIAIATLHTSDAMQQCQVSSLLTGVTLLNICVPESQFLPDDDSLDSYPTDSDTLEPYLSESDSETHSSDISLKKVEDLLEVHAEVNQSNSHGWTPVMEAAFKGHHEVLKFLLHARGNQNAQNKYGDSPLTLAIQEKNDLCVQILLDAKADTELVETLTGDTALMIAAESGNLEVMRMLLAAGAKIDAINELTGDTAIVRTPPNSSAHKLLVEKGIPTSA